MARRVTVPIVDLRITTDLPDLTVPLQVQLARQLDRVREARGTLADVEADLIERIANLVGVGGHVDAPDVDEHWVVKRRPGTKEWDHDALHRVMLARGRDARRMDPETGEVLESEGEAVARVIRECAGIGYWRVGDLKRYGVDADEYRVTQPGRLTVEAVRPDPEP